MDEKLTQMLIDEVKENRREIMLMRKDISDLDKHVFSNKMKLSLFIGGISLFFSMTWAIIFEKIKNNL